MTGTISIERAANDKPTFVAVFSLLLELHKSVGMAPINPDKLGKQCYGVLAEGMTFLAKNQSGEIVGSLGLSETVPYYSDLAYLQDKWFYVRPAYRGYAGLRLLLQARAEAIRRDTYAIVIDTNPDSRRNRRGVSAELAAYGFVSAGYMLRLTGRSVPGVAKTG